MISLTLDVVLLAAAILAVCSGQEDLKNISKPQTEQLFNAADIAESVQTGNVREEGHVIPTESGGWCENPVSRKYRTIDGTCNHPRNFGSSFKPIGRLLPPAYDDGENSPRQRGVDGLPLPSARTVSLNAHPNEDAFANHPIILMQWGQWIAHDLVLTASPGGERISCCGPNGGCPPFVTDPNCFPIEIRPNDPSFPGICLSFTRSLAYNHSNNVQAKPRQQINSVTGFLDCSQIYGSTPDVAAAVREPGGHLLLTKNGSFLPESLQSGCIKQPGTTEYCQLAGDSRVNQHPALGAINTVWVREHNRIATRLLALRPQASKEEIFQVARKMVIGMHQGITFNNYLPIILGSDASRWRLTSTSGRSAYNPGLDPSMVIAFTSAALRFGHSTVPSDFPIGDVLVKLRFMFNRPEHVLNNLDGLIAGMSGVSSASQKSIQSADRNFVHDMSRFLFMNNATGRGLDLISTNIQRGRDHGLPSYTKWRSFCGLPALTGFNDTKALGPFVSRLGEIYRSMDDIDLYTGMTHEQSDNGLVGPTFRCILRIQFYNTKYADRFFFDNDEPNVGFTDAQTP